MAREITGFGAGGLRLEWKDAQGDSFQIEPEETVADPKVIAGILVSDHADGEEAAVWVRRDEAQKLLSWLTWRLGNAEGDG